MLICEKPLEKRGEQWGRLVLTQFQKLDHILVSRHEQNRFVFNKRRAVERVFHIISRLFINMQSLRFELNIRRGSSLLCVEADDSTETKYISLLKE